MRLARLHIENFGLIARGEVAFADGLTIVSGETGSGKTMLLGALDFVLGERTGADLVRHGTERARVVAEVLLDDPSCERLRAQGISAEGDEAVVVVRELTATGRSSGRINGVPVSTAQLRELGELSVDIVGQHAQQRLLAPAYHLDLVDRFGGEALAAARERVAALYAAHAQVEREYAELRAAEGRDLAERDFARFTVDEITALALEPGEDTRLRERRDMLANAEKIATALRHAQDALAGEHGAGDALGSAVAALAGVSRFGDDLAALGAQTEALQSEANELAVRIARALEEAHCEPSELDASGERLAQVERLKKKHGGSLEDVFAARERALAQLERVEHRDELLHALEVRRDDLARDLEAAAEVLSLARTDAAGALEGALDAELAALAMPAARFTVAVVPLDRVGPLGMERCEFMLAPNPGEPSRPLAKVASGGELSRVLLALVVVIADRRERTALVFDEIDAGIGGATANAVGARLGRLAHDAQVVCVTHLAQIASWADAHYVLRKDEGNDATVVNIVRLEARADRLAEIARMLSGDAHDVSLEHAGTILRDVDDRKLALEAAR